MAEANFQKWDDMPVVEPGPGIRRRLVTGENVMSVQLSMDKGVVVPMHQHHHEQISHVVSGKVEFDIDGTKRQMGPGELVYIPGHLPHSVTMIEDSVMVEVFSPPREDFLND